MSSKRAMPRLVEVTLWMQRHGRLLPPAHCARAHRAFFGGSSLPLLRNSFPVDDWSRPLIESTSEAAVHARVSPGEMPKPVPRAGRIAAGEIAGPALSDRHESARHWRN